MRRGIARATAIACLALLSCDPGGADREAEAAPDPAAVARGRALFLEHCAICHGERADGRGPRHASLSRPPASFRSPLFEPDRDRVRRAIERGVAGSDMPGWLRLGEGAVDDLTAFVIATARSSR